MELGIDLIGRGGDPARPIERANVKTVFRRRDGVEPDEADPTAAYRPETEVETAFEGDLPAGGEHSRSGSGWT